MMLCTGILLALSAQLASAHYQLEYPYWRGDSFVPPASQYIFPCANVNQTESANNRTLWPTTGGSLVIHFHHPFTYVWMNLGLGSNISTFNISLNSMPLNETGNGTLCLPHVALPSDLDIQDGTNATLQIINVGDSGTALYNCADITFSSNATVLSGDQCKNDTGVSIFPLSQEFNGSTASTTSASTTSAASPSSSPTGMASTSANAWHASLLAGFISTVVMLGFSIGL